jgi:hypothetical protein
MFYHVIYRLHPMFVLCLSKMLIRLTLERNLYLNVMLFEKINYMIYVKVKQSHNTPMNTKGRRGDIAPTHGLGNIWGE